MNLSAFLAANVMSYAAGGERVENGSSRGGNVVGLWFAGGLFDVF